jgi:hypothetical protein
MERPSLILPLLGALACTPENELHLNDIHCFHGFDSVGEVADFVDAVPKSESLAYPSHGKDSFSLFFEDDPNVTQEDLLRFYREFDVAIACALDRETPTEDEVFYDFAVDLEGGYYTNAVIIEVGYLLEEESCEVVHVTLLTEDTGTPNCSFPIPVFAMDYDGDYRSFCEVKYFIGTDGEVRRSFGDEC